MSPKMKIDQLRALVDALRDADSEFPPQSLAILLIVAKSGTVTLNEIVDQVGLTIGAVSRNMQKLAVKHNGHEGMGFLEVGFIEGNYRTKEAKLTPKGERFLQKLSDCL